MNNNKVFPSQLKETNELNIIQNSHGFVAGDYLMFDKTSNTWKKANSVGIFAAGCLGRVMSVLSVNEFVFKSIVGHIIDYTGTAGEFYYVKDDGTGGLTLTPPLNQIQATLFALPNNKAIELSYPNITPSIGSVGNIETGDIVSSLSAFKTGYLLLDGAILNKTVYSDLWNWLNLPSNIATWLGITSEKFIDINATDFSIPDLRGIFLRNAGLNSSKQAGNGTFFGNSLGTYQDDLIQAFAMFNNVTQSIIAGSGLVSGSGSYNASPSLLVDQFTPNGYGTPRIGNQTQPANISINYFIKF